MPPFRAAPKPPSDGDKGSLLTGLMGPVGRSNHPSGRWPDAEFSESEIVYPSPQRAGGSLRGMADIAITARPAQVTADALSTHPATADGLPIVMYSGERREASARHASVLRSPAQIAPVLPPDPGLIVYTVGKGFRAEEFDDLNEKVASLHASPDVRTRCRSITVAAERFLEIVYTAKTGWGYVARSDVPSGIAICYYSIILRQFINILYNILQ